VVIRNVHTGTFKINQRTSTTFLLKKDLRTYLENIIKMITLRGIFGADIKLKTLLIILMKEQKKADTTQENTKKSKKDHFNFKEYLEKMREKFKCNCTISFD